MLNGINWSNILLILIIIPVFFIFSLANKLKIYDKNAWYNKWQYWTFGTICLIFPVFILGLVFYIQILTKVAKKLEVPGSEIYSLPYSWILCIVIPVVGWILLIVMYIYLITWTILKTNGGKYE